MDSNKLFLIGLTVLGLLVIAVSIWVILTPPYGDEPQGYALIGIGIFFFIIVYELAQFHRKSVK